jgi:hypothetical protein
VLVTNLSVTELRHFGIKCSNPSQTATFMSVKRQKQLAKSLLARIRPHGKLEFGETEAASKTQQK